MVGVVEPALAGDAAGAVEFDDGTAVVAAGAALEVAPLLPQVALPVEPVVAAVGGPAVAVWQCKGYTQR